MVALPTILHADLDSFYASVEQLLDPSLLGKAMAVGGGVVLAASYEAKAYGVHGGMSSRRARQLCPSIIIVDGHFSEYQRLADEVMVILGDFTPFVQRVSIDEAFLDVTGTIHLFGPPEVFAQQLRARVRDEIGLPISVGAAATKHLAKIASQVAKPDGWVVVDPAHERDFLDPLPVSLVWGIGPVAQQRLADRGIRTIGQLAESSTDSLEKFLGAALGSKVSALAANDDHRKVQPNGRSGSVGAQSAFRRREPDNDLLATVLGHLADRVASRLRAKQRAGRTVTVRVRFADMKAVTRSHTAITAMSTTLTLTETAETLVRRALAENPDEREITLLAIGVSNLVEQPVLQLELLLLPDDAIRPGSPTGCARWAVDHSMDAVRLRFGRSAVGYASVSLSDMANVPDEFRELAERDR